MPDLEKYDFVYPSGDPETIGVVTSIQKDKVYVQWEECNLDDGWYATNGLCVIK